MQQLQMPFSFLNGKHVFLLLFANTGGIFTVNPLRAGLRLHAPWWGMLFIKISLGRQACRRKLVDRHR